MSKKQNRTPAMSHRQTVLGWLYWMLQLFILPQLLALLNSKLPTPLSAAWLNIVFYSVNFIALMAIFHSYLGSSLVHTGKHFGQFLKACVLAFAVYWASNQALGWLLGKLVPTFSNINDASLIAMLRGTFWPLAIAMVVLVPVCEELCFRGLVFRGLYGKSRPAAYILSTLLFCAVHVTGYLGEASLPAILLSFVQYIPAGLCLAWACDEADNIFAPIVIHSVINFLGIYSVR